MFMNFVFLLVLLLFVDRNCKCLRLLGENKHFCCKNADELIAVMPADENPLFAQFVGQ